MNTECRLTGGCVCRFVRFDLSFSVPLERAKGVADDVALHLAWLLRNVLGLRKFDPSPDVSDWLVCVRPECFELARKQYDENRQLVSR
jgi:hypothetical protein